VLSLLIFLSCASVSALDTTKGAIDAIYATNVEEVERCLGLGVNANAKDDGGNGNTLLMHAAFSGSKEITELLIARGADVKARNKSGQTSLHVAAGLAKKDIATLLLDRGADVNAKDENGRTPLYFVVLSSMANGVTTLNFLQQWAIRQVFTASPAERSAVAEVLLDRGATVETNSKDASLVYVAATTGGKDLVTLLISHGADLDDAKSGETALHSAIAEGHLDVARLLINNGANVNARNQSGRTPLHFVASLVDDPDLAELLIQHGAHVNARESKFGATPLSLTVGRRNVRVAAVLRRHGGV
jgi:ankyrin repeat protein